MSSAITPRVAVIVVGAGSGTRLGHSEPKAFVPIAGRPMVSRALDPIFGMTAKADVVIVVPKGYEEGARELVEESAAAREHSVGIVVGAATRQGSVAAALAVLEPSVEVVLVHDAARPLTPSTTFDAIAAQVSETGISVVPGVAVTDTVKRTDAEGFVIETVDRSTLAAVQTPQGFPRAELVAAYAVATDEFTDDAALMAAAGHPVVTIAGDPRAFKVTTPEDLARAEQLLGRPTGLDFRVGTGTDVHAYDKNEPLWLAGLHWPDEVGLRGHSDGDVVSHAMCDALLSAANLGDLGSVFGTSDPTFHNAHGEVFLRETLRRVREAGFAVANISVQVIGNHPIISRRRKEAEILLTEIVAAPVSIAGTTTDGLGFTGRGEGVAAIATAMLQGRTR